ncbi:MAG: ABC1 kinase family protein [Nocardioidaceae bacterium]
MSTSLGLGPHARRYAALARLLVRHGRSDLLAGAGLDEFALDEAMPEGDVDRAEQLARDLEELGPTYVKLGQLLSTRFDLLPVAYTTALERLQDGAEPFPFETVQEIVETELGGSLRHLFSEFDPTPLAVASLGQVHRATTTSGRDVVVKVQRPDARETAREDMEVLTRLAGLADRHTGAGRRFGFGDLLAQFRRSLAGELDYRREARNLARFRELCEPYDLLVVPEPVPDYSTSRVLTMERLEGRKVTDVGPLGMLDVDARPMVDQLFRCYLTLMLQHGVLHADPHPGNVLLTDDGRLGLLDLGMVATVPPRLQDRLVRLLLAIADGDGEEAAAVLAGMGRQLEDYDEIAFRDQVAHLVAEAAMAGSEVQAGTVLMEMSRRSGELGLRPPAEMSMVGKALLNLDRVTLHLDPDFEPAEAIRDNVGDLLTSGLKVSPAGLMAAAIEAKEFTALLPKRANRILDALAEGQLTVQVQAMDEERLHRVLQRVANRVTLGIIIAATVLGAALMMRVPTDHRILGYPALAMGFFTFAVLAGAALGAWIVATDRKVARQDRSGAAG